MDQQQRIVQKAHEMFMRFGIRSVSMDEIAAQLGVSKKTIYQFFADKDALVEAVIDIEINSNEQECMGNQSKSENPIHEIFLAVDDVMEMLKVMNPTLVYDLQKYHEAVFRKLNDHKNKFFYKLTRDNLERGIAEGLYRPEINTDILTRLRLATIFLMFNPEMMAQGKNSPGDFIKEITMNFLYGLATPKGIKLIQKYTQQRQKHLEHEESRK